MTLRQLLLLIGIATGLLWVAWFWVLLTIDPFVTNIIGFILFYTTLLLALAGTLALAGFFFRKARLKEHPKFSSGSYFFSTVSYYICTTYSSSHSPGWKMVGLVEHFTTAYSSHSGRNQLFLQNKNVPQQRSRSLFLRSPPIYRLTLNL